MACLFIPRIQTPPPFLKPCLFNLAVASVNPPPIIFGLAGLIGELNRPDRGYKNGGKVARGCGAIMSNRRKKTKMM